MLYLFEIITFVIVTDSSTSTSSLLEHHTHSFPILLYLSIDWPVFIPKPFFNTDSSTSSLLEHHSHSFHILLYLSIDWRCIEYCKRPVYNNTATNIINIIIDSNSLLSK